MYFKQDCKECDTPCNPYKTEALICRYCGWSDCECDEDEKAARHVDKSRSHRSDLCHKCRAGYPCQDEDDMEECEMESESESESEDEGYSQGHDEGYNQYYHQGYSQGHDEGYNQGYDEACMESDDDSDSCYY